MTAANVQGTLHLPRRHGGGRRALARMQQLEDRLLIARNRADRLKLRLRKAGFDPNQVRGEDGQWSESGGGAPAHTPARTRTRVEQAKELADWVRSTPAKEVIRTITKSPAAREALSTAINAAISYATKSNDPINEEFVNTYVRNISNHARITQTQAAAQLRLALQRLRELRSKTLRKAKADPLIALIDEILAVMDKMTFEEKDLTKLEDRILIARNRADRFFLKAVRS